MMGKPSPASIKGLYPKITCPETFGKDTWLVPGFPVSLTRVPLAHVFQEKGEEQGCFGGTDEVNDGERLRNSEY